MIFLSQIVIVFGVFKLISCQDATYGSEFFIGIPKNTYYFNPTPDSLDLHISTASTAAITFTIEDINGVIHTGTVAYDDTATVNLDINYQTTDSTYSNRNKGIRVYTENGGLISVLVANVRGGSKSDYVAHSYQGNAISKYEYYTVSTGTTLVQYSSLAMLIGTANDTTVTITPSHDIVIPQDIQNSNSPDFTLVADSNYTLTLHRLQTFMFEAKNRIDLTGSKIVSDKPLTVVSGHECSNVPHDAYACEATAVQVPPTAIWGTQFLLTPHAGRTGGQYYKMVAAESSTTITYICSDGVPVNSVLESEGDDLTFSTPSGTYCYAESDKPVFTVILGTGGSLHEGSVGDPTMSLVPPIDTYTHSDIVFYVPNYGDLTSYWINIMSTQSNPVVLMNGEALSLTWNTINDNNETPVGYAAQMQLSQVGVDHNISSSAPITTLIQGWGIYRGLSYTIGIDRNCKNKCGEGEELNSFCGCDIVDICLAANPCQNGGTCTSTGVGAYQCSCPLLYTGDNCQVTSLADASCLPSMCAIMNVVCKAVEGA